MFLYGKQINHFLSVEIIAVFKELLYIEQEVLNEFSRARTHVIATVTLKHSYWTEPPFCVFGLGHPEKRFAREAWRKCMCSDDPHPRLDRLRSEPLKTQAELYFSDEHWDDEDGDGDEGERIDEFVQFCTEMRLTWTAERAVEGDHAKFHRRGKAAPHHSVHFLSFARRSTELKGMLSTRPNMLRELAELFHQHPTAMSMVRSLGLGHHPVVEEARQSVRTACRSKLLFAMPYLADPSSLYDMAAPVLTLQEEVEGRRRLAFDAQLLDSQAIIQKYAVAHVFAEVAEAGEFHDSHVWSVPLPSDSAVYRLSELLQANFRDTERRPMHLESLVPAPELGAPETYQNLHFL